MKAYESLDAFLEELPEQLEQLRGHDGLFRLETAEGRNWYVRLRDGDILVTQSETEHAGCTVRASEADLLALIAGRVSPMKLLMTRRVTAQGDVGQLMSLVLLMKR